MYAKPLAPCLAQVNRQGVNCSLSCLVSAKKPYALHPLTPMWLSQTFLCQTPFHRTLSEPSGRAGSAPPLGRARLRQHAPRPIVSHRIGSIANSELPVTRSCGHLGGGPLSHVQTQSLGRAKPHRNCGEKFGVWNNTTGLGVFAVSPHLGR